VSGLDSTTRLSTTTTSVIAPRSPRLAPVRKVRSGAGENLVLLTLDTVAVAVGIGTAGAPCPAVPARRHHGVDAHPAQR
jgi:hypothetical protein